MSAWSLCLATTWTTTMPSTSGTGPAAPGPQGCTTRLRGSKTLYCALRGPSICTWCSGKSSMLRYVVGEGAKEIHTSRRGVILRFFSYESLVLFVGEKAVAFATSKRVREGAGEFAKIINALVHEVWLLSFISPVDSACPLLASSGGGCWCSW